jgi:Spy/CpxP family protein refolding chaperone
MRTFWKAALIVAVLAACAAAAEPPNPIVPEGTTVQLILLRQKSVQEDLKLTPEVAKKVMDFTNKEGDAYDKALKLTGKERETKVEELEKENKKFLEDNLTPPQRKRLEQITLQVTGLQQLTRPEVAKALNLTDDQQQKFKALEQEARKELGAIIDAPNREGRNEKLAKLREETNKKIEALLTDQQKAKARELVGEPFKGAILFEEPEPGK